MEREKKSIEERLLEENKANKKNNKKHQRKKSYVNIPGLSEYWSDLLIEK